MGGGPTVGRRGGGGPEFRGRCGHIEPFNRRHGGECPGHQRLFSLKAARKTWMPATSAGMTPERSFHLIGTRFTEDFYRIESQTSVVAGSPQRLPGFRRAVKSLIGSR